MIEVVRSIGSPRNVGVLALESRIKLVNSVTMKSLIYNVEVIPVISNVEMKKLESCQLLILSRILEIPRSSPYMGILLETGMWTMESRIAYKKLMLYHNIKHSDDKRVIKKVLEIQELEEREGTWCSDVKEKIKYYGVEKDVNSCLKSEWKKEVKEKIGGKTEKIIRNECTRLRKTRTVCNDPHKLKEYLKNTNLTEAKDILRSRLHMTRLTCNYGHISCCPLCGSDEKIETEHYFSKCGWTKHLAKIWRTTANDLSGNLDEMKRAAKHLNKVEVLMEQYFEGKGG